MRSLSSRLSAIQRQLEKGRGSGLFHVILAFDDNETAEQGLLREPPDNPDAFVLYLNFGTPPDKRVEIK